MANLPRRTWLAITALAVIGVIVGLALGQPRLATVLLRLKSAACRFTAQRELVGLACQTAPRFNHECPGRSPRTERRDQAPSVRSIADTGSRSSSGWIASRTRCPQLLDRRAVGHDLVERLRCRPEAVEPGELFLSPRGSRLAQPQSKSQVPKQTMRQSIMRLSPL